MKRVSFVVWAVSVLGCSAACFAALPTNNNPKNQIRFKTPKEADARREKLTRFIWPEGLPTSRQPKVTPNVGPQAYAKHLKGVHTKLARRVSPPDCRISFRVCWDSLR